MVSQRMWLGVRKDSHVRDGWHKVITVSNRRVQSFPKYAHLCRAANSIYLQFSRLLGAPYILD